MSIKEHIKNEHILWTGKQDMKTAVLRAFINPLLIFVAAWFALSYQNVVPALTNPDNYTNAGLAIGMVLGYMIPVWVYLINAVSYILTAKSSEYAVTDNAVYIKNGVLSSSLIMKNFKDIRYINLSQSAVGKLTGTSDVKMTLQSGSIYYTNGCRHVHTTDFSNITDAEKVFKILQSKQNETYEQAGEDSPEAQDGIEFMYNGRKMSSGEFNRKMKEIPTDNTKIMFNGEEVKGPEAMKKILAWAVEESEKR